MIHPARISVNNIYYWLYTEFFKDAHDNQEQLDEEQTTETSTLLNKPKHSPVVPLPNSRFYIISIIMLIVGYTLAVSIKSFALVLAVVGATGSTSISFILPGLFGYKLSTNETKTGSVLKVSSITLVIWGFAVMFVCLYTSLFLKQA